MKVMLVDDEPLALQFLESQLHSIGDFTIVGAYDSTRGLTKKIIEKQPELLFLDIKIGAVNGVELASTIQEVKPDLPIVFVTGFHEYAVQAFELNALDYIVKPIQKDRLIKTIQRLRQDEINENTSEAPIQIMCMPTLQFIQNNASIPVHWRTSKAKEIFCYLLHHAGKPVRKDILIDEFWGESELVKSTTQLYSTIYVIRKTLAASLPSLSLTSKDQCYQLHIGDTKIDAEVWENQLHQLPPLQQDSLPSYQAFLREYKGDYFATEGYEWAETKQRYLRESWYKTAAQTGKCLEELQMIEDALSLYLIMQAHFPYISHSYHRILHLYSALGECGEVMNQYERLKIMLAEEYGVNPDSDITEWYESWRMQHM
ncbi:Two-component response regulator, SAPR family, consists of REC, wHTH and BTAD domains [Terribacillus aidingensis]|uniref:Two-component response regulator, SAPR family, consists of REC, wHTH and BTAD domains n=1 Tax=Terribacillus aidingensis TaxID=586416 RepID=A0A285NAI8_9BACI|nr:response regulator [Terribacillus aidingensis]SNZ04681.1 Two-component response regulator, SAPR family, consists of REC, wHTH and BTAD domains [Terribacillus aidingensis]